MTLQLSERTIGDKSAVREKPNEVLTRLISTVQLHRTADGPIYAEVPTGDRNETYGLKSRGFRDWLVSGYFSRCGEPPPVRALNAIIGVLEARARFLRTAPSAFIRVAHDRDMNSPVQYLDLGDALGRAVQISPEGWSVVRRPRIHFRRPEGYLPLPLPQSGGSIQLLRPYVNLGESEFRLLVCWLTAAIRPAGPYPILTIYGEQGSAKSTLAKVARLLVDPHATPLVAEPKSTRELMSMALNSWMLSFDNVSSLPNWLSDSLCRLAVGGGCAAGSPATTEDIGYLNAQRPMVLNGIDEFMRRGDAIDRSLVLNLPAIRPADRRSESEFWASFRMDYPVILGALLDAVALGLEQLPSLELPELPRMADFALWGEAVSRGLDWPHDAFLAAYSRNRRDATLEVLEDSLVATALLRLLPAGQKWTGTCAKLHESLASAAGKKTTASTLWPKSTRAFSSELRRIAPQLRMRGLNITFSRSSERRLVTIAAS